MRAARFDTSAPNTHAGDDPPAVAGGGGVSENGSSVNLAADRCAERPPIGDSQGRVNGGQCRFRLRAQLTLRVFSQSSRTGNQRCDHRLKTESRRWHVPSSERTFQDPGNVSRYDAMV